MALANYEVESAPVVGVASPFVFAKQELTFDPKDVHALIKDFFSWLENEWQQPVIQAQVSSCERDEILDQISFRFSLEENEKYTALDVATISRCSIHKVKYALGVYRIRAVDQVPSGHGSAYQLYLGKDLIPVLEKWKWDELCLAVDGFWARFFSEPCGICLKCSQLGRSTIFHCSRNHSLVIREYRNSFTRLLRAIQQYGDIASWWHHEQSAVFTRKSGSINQKSGIVLLYLFERRLLNVALDDLLRIPFPGLDYMDLLRPWRHRRPEEYVSFLCGLGMITHVKSERYITHAILAVLVLLHYGFPGLTELGRRLTADEVHQAVQEERLLTPHIAYGFHLGFPMSDDLRIGHVVFDDLRRIIWSYAIKQGRKGKRTHWEEGPRGWRISDIKLLERILTLNVWHNGQAILPLRPETEKILPNPYKRRQYGGQEGYDFHHLPTIHQKTISTYISYRYREQHIAFTSLRSDLNAVIPFFSWAQNHTDLNQYTCWDNNMMRKLMEVYLSMQYSPAQHSEKYIQLRKIYTFFHTLAKLELPHPPGYQTISSLLSPPSQEPRPIPTEEVLDRVFCDGVCQLDYDPFARLALTIQYYCGTRVTETIELPVFCVFEDTNKQFAYLVIPRGKTKEERSFPIVAVGMGPLFEYMEQVVAMQLDDDDMPRHASRMNVRYLETDVEKAYHWDYLFDRELHCTRKDGMHPRVLTQERVRIALEEALLFAAKKNPKGFFREETYSRRCRRQGHVGQMCGYVALSDGITVCPICGGALPGSRGWRCCRKLTRKFKCDGVGRDEDYFCPKCDAPLAEMISITPHIFRHNSVTRAHRNGVSLAQNMLLHGHKTVPMHLRYLHLLPEDQHNAVYNLFSEKFLRDIQLASQYTPGQVVEEGVARIPNLEQFLGVTLRRGLTRRTAGLWGGFWAGALAEEDVVSPLKLKAEMIITEETYHHAVAQYRYEALGLAVSEVALERGTKGKFKATIPEFLERKEIERVVDFYLEHIQQGYLNTARGVRLFEADIKAQRVFLNDLAEMLHPWWKRLGSIDRLIMELMPAGTDIFQKPVEGDFDELIQE